MSWSPRLQFPYSSGREKRIYPRVAGENLPVRALRRLWERDPRSKDWALRRYQDDVGVIGFEVGEYMLLAKRHPYGYIVSFTAEAVDYCVSRHYTLLLYLEEPDAFYTFDPAVVKATGAVNFFNGQSMLNVSIREGVRYAPGSAERREPQEVRVL